MDELLLRYGSPTYYEDVFHGFEFYDIRISYRLLDKPKSAKYEMARQNFLKLLGQQKMAWQPTTGKDKNVEISRLYRGKRDDYIAFMRIKPFGFRFERKIPPGIQITFHVLLGRVSFKRDKRQRIMTRGNYTTVNPRTTYSIRCICDQASYLVFKISQNPLAIIGAEV